MAENDPLSGLLGALIGGHPAVQNHMQNTGQSLDEVLGSISNAANPAAGGTSTGGSLGDILGSMMGGSPQAGSATAGGADPMSALLGGLLGGGTQGGPSAGALGNNAFLAPIVDAMAAKIGIQPQIAETVVSFALTQLMGGQRDPQLAQMLGGKGAVSTKYLRDSGLANQLAQQTGMDNKTAVKSLQQVFQALGTQMGEGTMKDRQQGLQSWLGTNY